MAREATYCAPLRHKYVDHNGDVVVVPACGPDKYKEPKPEETPAQAPQPSAQAEPGSTDQAQTPEPSAAPGKPGTVPRGADRELDQAEDCLRLPRGQKGECTIDGGRRLIEEGDDTKGAFHDASKKTNAIDGEGSGDGLESVYIYGAIALTLLVVAVVTIVVSRRR